MSTDATSIDKAPGANRRLTPMLRQYLDAKAECPQGALLLFRMGDFYELFFDDAVIAARELDLTLTSRDKCEDPIPMAGVPHHAVDQYIARLVAKGFTLAICDQVEDPRAAKGLVRRAVTRLITPGTVSDFASLDPGTANYLGHATCRSDGVVLVLLDLLAGELLCTETPAAGLSDEIARMGVRELLVGVNDESVVRRALQGRAVALRVTTDPETTREEAERWLRERLSPEAQATLQQLGDTECLGLARVMGYAETTQRRALTHFMAPRRYRRTDYLILDEPARRNLELLTAGPEAERVGSLLWHLDRCCTAMGSRVLSQWLLFPLRNKDEIETRLDVVAALKADRVLRETVRRLLGPMRDGERLTGRVAVGRATPNDLGAIRATLHAAPQVQEACAGQDLPWRRRWQAIDLVTDLQEQLVRALVDEPPVSANDGGIFRRGFDAELDELMDLADGGHAYVADLERRERQRTGIQNLKVRFNRVFGYYIEITKANLANIPGDYVRKQTLVGAERYITVELKSHEEKVLSADERRKAREQELFCALVNEVARAATRLRALYRLLAETDALASLAQVADEGRYERPEISHEPIVELRQSRHPVIERLLPGGERFVPNDVSLGADDRQLAIITGPNMAGKSTVMRQVALSVLLAQMGSFVPAKSACIGLCDRIFTRVGAADHLGRGQSTFMVEMIETATILACATKQSLVILDEIGRGTSTFDGVSIAWAVAEHLHDVIGCRALFATHYHELTDLSVGRPRVVNMSVTVKEHNDSIVFLRQLVDGAANRSYGIQVARLAGLPPSVLQRAREVLANLEQSELDAEGRPALGHVSGATHESVSQLQLFAAAPHDRSSSEACARAVELRRELAAIDAARMTPIDALVALDGLCKKAQEP